MRSLLRSCAKAGAALVSAAMIAVIALHTSSTVTVAGTAGADNYVLIAKANTTGVPAAAKPWPAVGIEVDVSALFELLPPASSVAAGEETDTSQSDHTASAAALEVIAATANPQTAPWFERVHEIFACKAIGCRPGEPGFPIGGWPNLIDKLIDTIFPDTYWCMAIGCRPGEPGFPIGGWPAFIDGMIDNIDNVVGDIVENVVGDLVDAIFPDTYWCMAIGCRPGEPGFPIGGWPAFIDGMIDNMVGSLIDNLLPDNGDPYWCMAIGCRPGEPGFPIGGTPEDGDPAAPVDGGATTPVEDEPVYCAAIGCRPGEPGYPIGGSTPDDGDPAAPADDDMVTPVEGDATTPLDGEPVYCAAIGCRPGEPGYPIGGSTADESTLEPTEETEPTTSEDTDDVGDADEVEDVSDAEGAGNQPALSNQGDLAPDGGNDPGGGIDLAPGGGNDASDSPDNQTRL